MNRIRKIVTALLLTTAVVMPATASAIPANQAASVRYKSCADYADRDFVFQTELSHPNSTEWSRRVDSSHVRIVFYTPIIVSERIYATNSDTTWADVVGPGAWAITVTARLGHFWSIGSVGTGATWYDGNSWYWYSDGAGAAYPGQNHCATGLHWIS